MSKLEVDAVEPQSGTALTLGASGDTITIPSGAIISNQGTATGFGPTGAVSWDVANIKTTGFTAVNGLGYFCNTTSSAFTVTLPASPSAGNVIAISDYAATSATNNITVNPNGNKIAGSTLNKILNTNGIAVTCVYVDSTEGWIVTDSGLQSNLSPVPYSIDFLVIAGGGSGGFIDGGGGGAGGYRTSTQTVTAGTAITVTVGDGGASISSLPNGSNNGSNSSISGSGLTTITSTGGGGGGHYLVSAQNGGSGGGEYYQSGIGNGNTPSTSPSQGNNGGTGTITPNNAGGGGGSGSVGVNGASGSTGGAGTASSITGSSVTRAGGGGGFRISNPASSGGSGGGGSAGTGASPYATATSGTVNTGSGGGGSADQTSFAGAGGKGVVILSMPDANYSGTTTGSPTVATGVSGKTVLTFNGSGSYTT